MRRQKKLTCCFDTRPQAFVRVFQIVIERLPLFCTATVRPSPEIACPIHGSCPSNSTCVGIFFRRSKSLTVPSRLPEANQDPPGENETDKKLSDFLLSVSVDSWTWCLRRGAEAIMAYGAAGACAADCRAHRSCNILRIVTRMGCITLSATSPPPAAGMICDASKTGVEFPWFLQELVDDTQVRIGSRPKACCVVAAA